MRTIKFTKEGYENLEKEHFQLSQQRKEAVQNLSIARDMGDRSENAAYKSARMKLSSIDSRLRHLETLLKFGKIVERTSNDIIEIGTTVTIHDGTNEHTYSIVGGYESDLSTGKISHISPIGKALLGKRVNDVVSVQVPAGVITYKVTQIL